MLHPTTARHQAETMDANVIEEKFSTVKEATKTFLHSLPKHEYSNQTTKANTIAMNDDASMGDERASSMWHLSFIPASSIILRTCTDRPHAVNQEPAWMHIDNEWSKVEQEWMSISRAYHHTGEAWRMAE